ncbi:MAG: ABC transporter ATP-binding protein [Hyphomicrobiaceae bacterium]
MTELIKTHGLIKRFGDITAVNGISLSVQRGEVLGFLGPNGAGKSTTMKMITGFLAPDEGTVAVSGIDMRADPMHAKQSIGYLPEGAPAYGDMTARSFLKFIAEVRGFDGADRDRKVDAVRARTGLAGVMSQRVETLSKGYKRRVGLAQAILHDPEVLILDEPTDGLDPNQKYHVRSLIEEMAAQKAIVVSTHILEEVEAVCTRAVIIDKGRIVADGTAEDLQRRLPYHNAVSVTVAADASEPALAAMKGIGGVRDVEEVSKANGHAHLRALSAGNGEIIGDVAAALREKSISVDQIYVERGRLDDVFRDITTSDGGRAAGNHAAGGARA